MSNQLKVEVVNSKVVLPDSYAGIDVNNLISSLSNSSEYTATEDCWFLYVHNVYRDVRIDGINLDGQAGQYTESNSSTPIILKKGQRIGLYYGGVLTPVAYIVVYGLKY